MYDFKRGKEGAQEVELSVVVVILPLASLIVHQVASLLSGGLTCYSLW